MSEKANRVLVVEDDSSLQKMLVMNLKAEGYHVVAVDDGIDALEVVRSQRIDAVILDVMLPYKDGFTIGSELRQTHPQLPIIYLTAKNQQKDILKGFESGGNDYIKKPFSMEELIVRINNILNLTKPNFQSKNQNNSIELGKYIFHPKKFELHFGDHIKKLSNREAQLFHIFCKNKNTSVKRKDILVEVWDDDSIYNSRNLDVYITKLRELLKKDSSLKIITLKGFGYHFVVE